ncbi:MAG TPA: PBP1A family penicillin-binding protein [Blastocatellia bacterium]|jgi:penicillin-binding protein 1A|nr:PBP1A family penicillin-binding protein [Blastocatellia bacterium]
MSDNYFLTPDHEPDGSDEKSPLMALPYKLTEKVARLEDFFRVSTTWALMSLALIAGGMTGLVFTYQMSLSQYADDVDGLANYKPPQVTKVFADDGKTPIGELSLERRIPLEYKDIPERMKQAILAIEDTRFYDHLGIDPVRLAGAVLESVLRNRRARGTSTLTQQLARGLFLSRERTSARKLKEALYALQIERVYTKEQIITLYCNQIFLGGGAYGFQAAANYYFSKDLKDLNLEQYALLAALPKGPQQFSPTNNPKAARDRRNLVLQSMADAGFISEQDAETAKAKPLGLQVEDPRGKNDRSPYAYFVEEVRQELQRIMTETPEADAMDVYKAGLSVYTTIDAQAQKWAVDAVRKGARMYERRHGWKVKFDNVVEKGGVSVEDYRDPSWIAVPEAGDIITGMIKDVSERGAQVSFGLYSAFITVENTEALGKPPSKLFIRGDLAQFKIESVDRAKRILSVTLDPEPDVQAALVLLDEKTGEIKAMVGGYNFATSKFNHATQANRQTGSTFKPFIYATAIEQGLKPDDVVDDSPFQRGSWAPHNYDESFMGEMPLRRALALSRNIPAVRVLDEVGVQNAANLVKRLGLPNPMAPFLPSALGATEEPLLAMVSAYSTFPNGGVRVEPVRIRKVVDRDGKVQYQAAPKSYKVLSDYVAAQMVDMMRGTVQFGTATAAQSIGHELAGKTGTMDNFTDAWFIGYTPKVVCGVWIGYSDRKKSLGKGESGATAALPFWIDFMQNYLKYKPRDRFGKIPDLPDDLRLVQANRAREHAKELARIAAREGDILPGSDEVPNPDPLAGRPSTREKAPTPLVRPAPPIREERIEAPRPEQQKIIRPPVDPKPQTPDEPARKGKKGKAGNPL